jgi:hypothetical protein
MPGYNAGHFLTLRYSINLDSFEYKNLYRDEGKAFTERRVPFREIRPAQMLPRVAVETFDLVTRRIALPLQSRSEQSAIHA